MTGLAPLSINWSVRYAANQYIGFKLTYELYFNGPLADLTEERKLKYLLIWSGNEGRELADIWNLQGEDAKSRHALEQLPVGQTSIEGLHTGTNWECWCFFSKATHDCSCLWVPKCQWTVNWCPDFWHKVKRSAKKPTKKE